MRPFRGRSRPRSLHPGQQCRREKTVCDLVALACCCCSCCSTPLAVREVGEGGGGGHRGPSAYRVTCGKEMAPGDVLMAKETRGKGEALAGRLGPAAPAGRPVPSAVSPFAQPPLKGRDGQRHNPFPVVRELFGDHWHGRAAGSARPPRASGPRPGPGTGSGASVGWSWVPRRMAENAQQTAIRR